MEHRIIKQRMFVKRVHYSFAPMRQYVRFNISFTFFQFECLNESLTNGFTASRLHQNDCTQQRSITNIYLVRRFLSNIQPVPELPPHRKQACADSKTDSNMTKIQFFPYRLEM
jgi:hypothetical protein